MSTAASEMADGIERIASETADAKATFAEVARQLPYAEPEVAEHWRGELVHIRRAAGALRRSLASIEAVERSLARGLRKARGRIRA